MNTIFLRLFPTAGLVLLCAASGTASADDGDPIELLWPRVTSGESQVRFVEAIEFLEATAAPRDAAAENRLRRAVADYLQQIDDIEYRAAQDRASARARLQAALGEGVSALPIHNEPGLIGGSTVNGEKAGIVYRYHHGRLLAADQIRSRFHGADAPFPDVRIELVGYVNVPRDMTVKIWHAAGGVNNDHGELTIDDRLLGTVGDDLVKNVIYVVKLPEGAHRVRWVLTGGVFQNNLLKFEDPQTGNLLDVFYDAGQREVSGADSAREVVDADRDPSEWSIAGDPTAWRWEVIGDL
jgi:hypothetical protein